MRRLAPLWLLVACGESEPLCPAPSAVLGSSGDIELSCDTAEAAHEFIEVLAVRAVPKDDRERLYATLTERFAADPPGTLADLEAAAALTAKLRAASGLDAAEARSAAVYEAFKHRGPLMGIDDAVVSTMSRTVQLWTKDDDTRLALTELDVEGWLFYGSLCREVQGARPLKLSVADRVPAYQVVQEAFEGSSRQDQIALAAMGPFWPNVKERWAAASYEEQQAWIAVAPLPPPMTSSSLGYFEAVMVEPPGRHARSLHEKLGPLSIRPAR